MQSTVPSGRAASRPAGRPRDERIDASVRAATVALLEEVGYPALSITAVAARAGTSAPAVYRRYRSKPELVYRAVFAGPGPSQPWVEEAVWREDVAAGVRALVVASIDFFTRRAVRAALSGLFAEMATRPGLSGHLLGQWQETSYADLQRCLDAAGAAVEARALLDLVSGTVLMALSNERDLDDAWVDLTVRIVTTGIGA